MLSLCPVLRRSIGCIVVTPAPSRFNRRTLLIGAGASAAAVAAGGYYVFQEAFSPMSNVGKVDFRNSLAIPPLADSTTTDQSWKSFDLTLQTGETAILPKTSTATWGVNGPFLGPTVRARRGESVAMTVQNELPNDTSLHWHGMHLPAIWDGGPHQTIHQGESWSPGWEIDQPASTLWYHPHPHGETADQVYRGVAGLFLVDDDVSDSLDIPREYGIDDIPLIVQDKRFDSDGQFSFDNGSLFSLFSGRASFGIMGEDILVNGTYGPVFEPTRQLTRFRLLNGSNARFYNVGFDDDRPFRLIATDNGFVPGDPVDLTRLTLGPGERAEIVVEFDDQDNVMLRSFEQDLGAISQQVGGKDTFEILHIRVDGTLEPSPRLPDVLVDDLAAPRSSDSTQRELSFDGHNRINGQKMDMSRIDEVVPANAFETWNISSSGNPHTFHLHGATFYVREFAGQPPPDWLRGPKDTVMVTGRTPVSLAVQFREFTDPHSPYMFHCHLLQHEDNGMMGQFVVVDPSTEDEVPRTIEAHRHIAGIRGNLDPEGVYR